LIGERLEDFEAAEPDENHRGPATIGQMLGIIWMILVAALVLAILVGFGSMLCGGTYGCTL
jgi:hypothetical protein